MENDHDSSTAAALEVSSKLLYKLINMLLKIIKRNKVFILAFIRVQNFQMVHKIIKTLKFILV